MLLTMDHLLACLSGSLSFRQHCGVITPCRFTRRQMKAFSAHEPFLVRAGAASGIRFSCRTDASALRMGFRPFPGSSRDLYGFDLYVDGLLSGHMEGITSKTEEAEAFFPLPAGEKRVDLYFPVLSGCEILSLRLEDASFAAPVSEQRHLLALGDSITQGYTVRFPSLSYVNRIARALGADVVNQAIGGDTFRSGTLDPDAVHSPDLLLAAYGTNDWSQKEKGQLLADAQAYMDRLAALYPSAAVCVITPIWRGDLDKQAPSGIPFRDWCRRLADLASAHPHFSVIDGFSLVPPVPELFEDLRIHPNEIGFELYARNLLQQLKGG